MSQVIVFDPSDSEVSITPLSNEVVSVLGACGCDSEDCEIVTVEADSDAVVVLYQQGPPGPRGPAGPAGPVAPPWIDSGTRASPNLITSAITLTTDPVLRVFIAGNGAPVTNPTMTHVVGNLRVILFGASDANPITLGKSFGNLELSGDWYGKSGSQIALDWDGASKYVEAYRNEI